MIKLINNN